MHGYLEKELTQLRMEINQDAEMADDEGVTGAVRSGLLASFGNCLMRPF
jgi:hypothetical protein